MQAVTALAHLRACILYFMDPSEQCGHSLEDQVKLFNSIKPLFANKPLIIVANKSDIIKMQDLSIERRAAVNELYDDKELEIIEMSAVTDEGVIEVKNQACEKLLSFRVDQKMRTKKVSNKYFCWEKWLPYLILLLKYQLFTVFSDPFHLFFEFPVKFYHKKDRYLYTGGFF